MPRGQSALSVVDLRLAALRRERQEAFKKIHEIDIKLEELGLLRSAIAEAEGEEPRPDQGAGKEEDEQAAAPPSSDVAYLDPCEPVNVALLGLLHEHPAGLALGEIAARLKAMAPTEIGARHLFRERLNRMKRVGVVRQAVSGRYYIAGDSPPPTGQSPVKPDEGSIFDESLKERGPSGSASP
jgi:hypothetical protein